MKVWPRDLDMRGKRVRLDDDTVVDIPADADRHVRDLSVYHEWESGYVCQNTADYVNTFPNDIVEIIEPVAVPDNAGAEKRGAELHGDPTAEPLHKRAHAAYHRIKEARAIVMRYSEACKITTGRAPETLFEAVVEMALAMSDLLPGDATTDTVGQRTDHSKRIQKLRFRVQLEAQVLSKQFPNIAERLAEIAEPQPGDLATLQEMRCIDDTTTDRDAVKKGES